MKIIQVYDKPMCCSTGVCGPQVDPVLPQFAADLDWLKSQGNQVERFNLAQQPMAFIENKEVHQLLGSEGTDCLPLILINGKIVSRKEYPSREVMAGWVNAAAAKQCTTGCKVRRMLWINRLLLNPRFLPILKIKGHLMKFLEQTTRNLFFTGKGGVGKTSVACAAAVRLADAGKKVLLVSTDPASNLDEVLGTPLGHHPTVVPSVPGLSAMNLDPEKSAAEYRERMVGPYRGQLPAAAVASMEEQFSGSCTLEIAAFDEFSRLLGDASATSEFDHVIFDTAPTGHTLRLLTLPSAWAGFMEKNTTGTSCLGPLAGLQAQQKLYQDTVKALGDPNVTTLVLVARAEGTALREAARTSNELAGLGVKNQHLVVNGVFQATDLTDPYALAMQKRGETAMDATP